MITGKIPGRKDPTLYNINVVEVLNFNGLRIEHYIPAQPIVKKVLVFHPGMFSRDWIFDSICRMYMHQGYECYVVIPRGHGTSLRVENLGIVSIDDYINDMLGFIKSLDREIILIGHSMGALICNQVISDGRQQVVGFASLMSAPYWGSTMSLRTIKNIPTFFHPMVAKTSFKPSVAVARELFFNRLSSDHAVVEAWKTLGEESGTAAWEIVKGKYSQFKISCPWIVVKAVYDNITPFQKSVYRGMKNPFFGKPYTQQFAEVGTSHAFMYDHNWQEVTDRLHKWFKISFPQM